MLQAMIHEKLTREEEQKKGVFILEKLRHRVRSFDLTNCACTVSENGGLSK